MKLPEIRIDFSSLLYSTVSVKLCKLNNEELPTREQCREWTKSYRKEWKKHEKKILEGMTEILGLEFYADLIDVHLAPGIIPMSDPLIINFGNYPAEFVDELTHELLHVLLTDNNLFRTKDEGSETDLGDEWQKLFPGYDNFSTIVHIPVHAAHKKIYLEVLKDEARLTRNIEHDRNFKLDAYLSSWDCVDKLGADEIIAMLKESYKKIAVEPGAKK